MTARPSPRLRQPYSPRCPSPLGLPPLGFPPLAPHMAFVNSPSLTGSLTPERHIYPRGPPETRVGGGGAGAIGVGGGGGGNGGVPYPPEARRPLAGTQSRRRSQPVALAPLSLNNQYHPPTQPQQQQQQQPKEETGTQREGAREMTEMEMTVSPPSPTLSDTSSLSLYSSDSVTKSFPVDVVQHPHLQANSNSQGGQKRGQQQEEEDERPPSLFCGCINLKAWFGGSSSKSKENRILGPPARPVPEPVPQTVQVGRRRPSPLNL